MAIGARKAITLRGRHIETGVEHAERFENSLTQEGIERLSRDHFHEAREDVRGNAVVPPRSGLVSQRDLPELGDDVFERRLVQDFSLPVYRIDDRVGEFAVRKTGGVTQKIVDPHRPARPFGRDGLPASRLGKVGYLETGELDGVPVSAASTGIGAPSTAILVEELAKLGSRTFIRVGSSGGMDPDLQLGELAITAGSELDRCIGMERPTVYSESGPRMARQPFQAGMVGVADWENNGIAGETRLSVDSDSLIAIYLTSAKGGVAQSPGTLRGSETSSGRWGPWE